MANAQTYTGDGTTISFYFTFPFFGTNDINVSINNVHQTSANFAVYPTQTPGDAPDVPYTGGRIDFAAAPANGATIKIWRNVEISRHIDYQPTNQPLSHQLNQDINQCIEILKEQNETLGNVISLANLPTVADLLSELETIRGRLDDFLTADDLDDINTAIEDIPTKANKDMDNITATGKENIIGNLMPDYSTGVQVVFNGITEFTAPYDCFVSIQLGLKNGAQDLLYIDSKRIGLAEGNTSGFTRSTFCIYMKKNQTITGIVANDSNRDSCLYYFKLNGEL